MRSLTRESIPDWHVSRFSPELEMLSTATAPSLEKQHRDERSEGLHVREPSVARGSPGDELAAVPRYRRHINGTSRPLQVCNRNRQRLRNGRLSRGARRQAPFQRHSSNRGAGKQDLGRHQDDSDLAAGHRRRTSKPSAAAPRRLDGRLPTRSNLAIR